MWPLIIFSTVCHQNWILIFIRKMCENNNNQTILEFEMNLSKGPIVESTCHPWIKLHSFSNDMNPLLSLIL